MKDTRQYKDRAEYLKKAVAKRRKKLRLKAIAYKGGRCCHCGYTKCVDALEFHHINRDEKNFGLSASGFTRSWERIQKEIDTCILVCANCHRELHASKSSFLE